MGVVPPPPSLVWGAAFRSPAAELGATVISVLAFVGFSFGDVSLCLEIGKIEGESPPPVCWDPKAYNNYCFQNKIGGGGAGVPFLMAVFNPGCFVLSFLCGFF